MTAIVKTKLLFLDSDSVSSDGTGTKFNVQIPSGQITAGDGQFMRISLQDFSMLKNFYNINQNNNTWVVTSKNNNVESMVEAEPMDYQFYYDIIDSIGDTSPSSMVKYMNSYELNSATITKWVIKDILPGTGVMSGNTTNRIMSFVLEAQDAANAPAVHGLTDGDLVIQCRNHDTTNPSLFQKNFSDSYEIFGARRVTDALDFTSESFRISFPLPAGGAAGSSTSIKIEGYYPMQRFTMEHIFLRADIAGSNFASHHFNKVNSSNTLRLSSTPLFAKMPIFNETVTYRSSQHQDYFFDYYDDNLTHIQLQLTDCDGRSIPIVYESQTRQGNMNFTVVLRIDVLAYGKTGFDKLVGPSDNLIDISSDVRRTLIGQGKPAWRTIPAPAGLNGQFFPKQPAVQPQTGDHPEFPSV